MVCACAFSGTKHVYGQWSPGRDGALPPAGLIEGSTVAPACAKEGPSLASAPPVKASSRCIARQPVRQESYKLFIMTGSFDSGLAASRVGGRAALA